MNKYSKQNKISIRRFLCVSILIFGISIFFSMRVNATTVSYDSPSYYSLIPHDPISVTSDSNFTDYGFPGTGTELDPYVIEGYNITTTSINGIYVNGTTKYFTISNCYIDASDGIFIGSVADGTATVINNTCNNNNNIGIVLSFSGSSIVANNTCNYNGFGIVLSSSDSSTVANNSCINNNDGYGIFLMNYSDYSTVANNTCTNNDLDGIFLIDSGNSTVANNT